jgi:hypothetical protein
MAEFATLAVMTAGSALGAVQAQRRAEAENAAQGEAVRRQMEQQRLAAEIEERRRREQLARERAERLARFGGQGLAGTGGSADAVLEGLAAESARRGAEAGRARSLGLSHSLLDLADRNRLNLLRAAEARERAILGVAEAGARTWRDLERRR